MLVVEIVLAVVVVFAVAAITIGRGGSIVNFSPDWPGRALPDGRAVRADDVANARFSLAFRGYRMAEVDTALDRLALEIAVRDARIEQLTGRPYELGDLPAEAAEPGHEDSPDRGAAAVTEAPSASRPSTGGSDVGHPQTQQVGGSQNNDQAGSDPLSGR